MKQILDETVTLEIPASAADCYAIMKDYEGYMNWQSAVKHVEVTDRDGALVTVAFKIGIVIGMIRYVLEYRELDDQMVLAYRFIDGDIKNITGEFRVTPLGDDRCLASYRIVLEPGFWVPKTLVAVVKNTSMKGVLKELKNQVASIKSSRSG